MPTLIRGVHAKRPFRAFLALILLPVGPTFLWVALGTSSPVPEGTSMLVPLLIGAGCSAWGAFEAWAAFRPTLRQPGLRALLERPESIVWFYALRAKSGNFIRVHLDNHKVHDMPLWRRRDSEAALTELRALLPHATEGYSLERLTGYQRSPGDLRRSPHPHVPPT
ncbi:MAG: hypothetical protein H6739_22390 [Alphaproteobacteria bacterium]|nr:hypothetical protein [Alphaproteobacteria bacterium]